MIVGGGVTGGSVDMSKKERDPDAMPVEAVNAIALYCAVVAMAAKGYVVSDIKLDTGTAALSLAAKFKTFIEGK